MTATPAKKPARKVETVHAGACSALRMTGRCQCPGYLPDAQVAGYPQCVCGHTQPSHALLVASLGPEPSSTVRTRAA